MGHINLAILQEQELRWYMLSYAADMAEVWLAKVNDDGSTKMIKEFKCKKFEDCFRDLKRAIAQLGEVKEFAASGVDDRELTMFKELVISKSDGILPVNNPKSDGRFWNWLQNDSYMIL